MKRVVLVSPSGSVFKNIAELGLEQGDGTPELTVLAWSAGDAPGEVRAIPVSRDDSATLSGRLRRAVDRALSGSAAGRNLFRLTPWDGGRRMWRAVRRNPAAFQALRDADLIVAVERDAILTAWKSVHSLAAPGAAAVYGLPSARTILAETRLASRAAPGAADTDG